MNSNDRENTSQIPMIMAIATTMETAIRVLIWIVQKCVFRKLLISNRDLSEVIGKSLRTQ